MEFITHPADARCRAGDHALPVFFALAGKRVVRGRHASGGLEGGLLSAAGAEVDVLASNCRCAAVAADPPRAHRRASARLGGGQLPAPPLRRRLRSNEGRTFVASAARAPACRERHRQAALLRLLLRLDRQPLAAGRRHLGGSGAGSRRRSALASKRCPARLSGWAEAARRWREEGESLGIELRRPANSGSSLRRVRRPSRSRAGASRLEAFLAHAQRGAAVDQGSVVLVGADPGDRMLALPGGARPAGGRRDLIDDLVAPRCSILRREAEDAGRQTGGRLLAGRDQRADGRARQGRQARGRLGRRPMILAAPAGIAACRAAGIAVEVVPGINAAQGAASQLALSLTHRKLARRVQYLPRTPTTAAPADIDWASVADPSTERDLHASARSPSLRRPRSPAAWRRYSGARRGVGDAATARPSPAPSPISPSGSQPWRRPGRCW